MYTGKGGVGKTSVAAATALCCAEQGLRTIVLSTDAAHSLADSLDLPLGPEPTPVADRLWGQEIDVLHQMDKHWHTVQQYLAGVLTWQGIDGLVAEETSVLPGMDELAALLQIVKLYDDRQYDLIVVDCAPTGETLRLLSLPEAARWYLERIFPLQRTLAALAGPLLRGMADIPVPDRAVFEAIEHLIKELGRMHALLTDPEVTSVRLVMNPERMVIKEAQRTYTYLNLYGYATDLVVCNRVWPEAAGEGYFAAWREIQGRHGRLIDEAFAPLPIRRVPLFEQEVVGLAMLRRMAQATYEDQDPAAVFYRGPRQEIVPKGDGYHLRLPLPFAERGDVQLTRIGDELVVRIGNHKRNIILPRTLQALDVGKATFEGSYLVLEFAGKEGTGGN
ncbi:MAG: ArsA family ATPase [Anaerolineae bacterium]